MSHVHFCLDSCHGVKLMRKHVTIFLQHTFGRLQKERFMNHDAVFAYATHPALLAHMREAGLARLRVDRMPRPWERDS